MKIFGWLVLAAVMTVGAGAQAQSVGGNYRVEGTNFDGSRYGGTARIQFVASNICRIHWDTGSTSSGICMVHGSAFSASYTFDTGVTGLALYEVMPDGRLRGVWTVSNSQRAGTETLIPIR